MNARNRPATSEFKTATASACAKAILVGEHFVVWGGTALAFPLLNAKTKVTIAAHPSGRNSVSIASHPEDERLLKAARRSMSRLVCARRWRATVSVSSDFPHSAGLGGSASYSVALSRAFQRLAGGRIDDDLAAQTAFELEKFFHRNPSGIDSTTIAFETPCYVKTGQQFVVHDSPPTGPVAGFIDIAPGGMFILADSGERSLTDVAIAKVEQILERKKGEKIMTRLTDVAETVALQTASALRVGDFEYVGGMLSENHLLLQAIGISTERIDLMRKVALDSGALGAKITGAGMGGFLLAVAWPDDADRVVDALRKSGVKLFLMQSTESFGRN